MAFKIETFVRHRQLVYGVEEKIILKVNDSTMKKRIREDNFTKTRSHEFDLPDPFTFVSASIRICFSRNGTLSILFDCSYFDEVDVDLKIKTDKYQGDFPMIKSKQGYGRHDFIDVEDLEKNCLSKRGYFHFEIHITKIQGYPKPEVATISTDASILTDSEIARLVHEEALLKFIESDDGADVTLIVDGQRIPALKSLLIAQSDVFKVMFSGKWKDSSLTEVEIKDVFYDQMVEFVRALYIGYAKLDSCSMAIKVFKAAHMYQVAHIMKQCEAYISLNLNETNVHEFLHVGSFHHSTVLTQAAESYITRKGLSEGVEGISVVSQEEELDEAELLLLDSSGN